MKRRGVLAAVASVCPVLAAGCASPLFGSSTETTVVPTADDISFDARVLDGSPDESPPRVAVELRNVADNEVVVADGATLPFTTFHSVGGRLALVPDDREYVFPVNGDELIPGSRGDCWTLGANIAVNDIGLQTALESGESATTNFSVLASSSDPCPGAGTYRFENTVSVRDARNDPGAGPTTQFTLSFTVDRAADGRITGVSSTI